MHKISFDQVTSDVKCQAFNGILGECADVFEQRMPLFELWERAWNFTTLAIEIQPGKIRYTGKFIPMREVRAGDHNDLKEESFEVFFSTTTITEEVIAGMFNKRIMHTPITVRGCYDLLTNTWGGK